MSIVSMTPSPPPPPLQPATPSPAPPQAPPAKHAQQPPAKTAQDAAPTKPATKDSDDSAGATKTQPHFGKALDDAKGKPTDDAQPAQADAAELAAALPVAKPVVAKPTLDATKSGDDDKDAASAADDGTSLATAMLALIGIPPKVAVVAGDALGKLAGQLGKGGKVADADASVPTLGDATASAGQDATATSAISPVVSGNAVDTQALAGLVGASSKHDAASALDNIPTTPVMVHAGDAPQAAAPPVQLQSTQVATTPAFAQELGDQIAWLGGQNIQQARIRLHPEDLGQLDVKVSVEHGKVNVAFAAQHPGAVTAVQQTLSQLDAMLAHHGLSLGHAEVSQQQAGRDGSYAAQHGGNGENVEGGAEDTAALPVVRVSKGLVDDFA
jgi:flagellar hook-length control protein FliK